MCNSCVVYYDEFVCVTRVMPPYNSKKMDDHDYLNTKCYRNTSNIDIHKSQLSIIYIDIV